MFEPYYFRSQSYRYSLQSHPTYYFYVGRSDTIQALWGLIGGDIYIFWFADSGELMRVEKFDINTLYSFSEKGNYQQRLELATNHFRQKFSLKDCSILVKRFWNREIKVGIEDVTDGLKEFLVDETSFDDDEIDDYKDLLEDWKTERMFALL